MTIDYERAFRLGISGTEELIDRIAVEAECDEQEAELVVLAVVIGALATSPESARVVLDQVRRHPAIVDQLGEP